MGQPALITLVAIFTVVFIWLLMNKLTCGKYDALDIGLLYMQILAIVFSFASAYDEHSTLYREIVKFFNLVNFDVRHETITCEMRCAMCHMQHAVCR